MNKLNSQKGFVVPLVIGIVVVLIAGGVYFAMKNGQACPAWGCNNPNGGLNPNATTTNNNSSVNSNPTATVDQASYSITSLTTSMTITGTANTDAVLVNVHASSSAKPNGMNWLGNESVPVVNGHWSITIPSSMLSGMISFSPLTLQVGIKDSNGVVKTLGTAVLTSAQATPANVNGWQTYTNSQYGITFNYPSNWGTPSLVSDGSVNFGGYLLVAFTDVGPLTPEVGTPMAITVGGKQGTEEWSSQQGTIIKVPFTNLKALELGIGSKPDDVTLKQILSSIKFTN